VFQEEQEDRRRKHQWHNQTGNIICRTPEVRWGKPTDQRQRNLRKVETCSRTKKLAQGQLKLAQGQRNLLKDIETCSRTLKLAQGQRNLLKDIGT
jgi:hypothetical protein